MSFSRWFAVIAALLALAVAPAAMSGEVSTQKSSANGVTVAVTPNIEGTSTWSFKIVLDTHSQDLSDDLVKTSAMIGPDGKRYAPLAWDGAAPGGHHREGVLRFAAVAPRPASIDLEIRRASEPAPRVFTWQMQP
ncbi:MAG TPA: hypothetical protein VHP37_32245 [Burkholderiales bacterium]|nr:hypothetical protein [Burkholderiales bacterium]